MHLIEGIIVTGRLMCYLCVSLSQLYSIVAIDAKSYKGKPVVSQYEESSVLRDLNKAVVGFSRIGERFTPAPWVPWQEGTWHYNLCPFLCFFFILVFCMLIFHPLDYIQLLRQIGSVM